MPESITEPVIPVQRSYAAVLSDLEGDDVTLRNIRRPNIAPTGIRFDASHTSLDLWYVGLDVTADILSSFRHWLSDGELVRAERFHFGLHRARYIVGRGRSPICACQSARLLPRRCPVLVWKERQADA